MQGKFHLTNAGQDLLAKVQTGTPLVITRVAIGDGVTTNYMEALKMNSLKNEITSFQVRKNEVNRDENGRSNGESTLNVVIENSNVQSGFYMREIGVFAQDPEVGEILYYVMNDNEYPIYIRPISEQKYELDLDIITVIGNAIEVQIIVKGTVYATLRELNDLAGVGRTWQTVKNNYDLIVREREERILLEIKLLTGSGQNVDVVTFGELSNEENFWGIWDKENRRLIG